MGMSLKMWPFSVMVENLQLQEITTNTWKSQRREITVSYGYLTFIITLVFLLVLPKWNSISNYIYYKFLKFSRWLRLNPEIHLLRLNPMSTQMIIFWSIILTFLSLNQTKLDLRFIAARLGRVPVYCLPTILFLTLRPSPLPNVLYLSLLPVHKWLSRIVILQSLLHTLSYLYIMLTSDTLHKIRRFDNLNGCIAMVAFIVIIITSLPSVRRSFYKIFFINHYICTWIVTITLYLHVRPGIPYLTLLNCFILFYQFYYKIKMSTLASISTVKISDNMIVVQLPNDSIAEKHFLPGCHIRLIDYNTKHSKFWNYLKLFSIPIQHPYTLASLPNDKYQKLIIRIGNYKLINNNKYLITGAYLPYLSFIEKLPTPNSASSNFTSHNHEHNLNSLLVKTKVKKCLIVVGGSAISFALPILRVLNYNGAMVKIIWIIRDHEDLKVLDYFQNYLINDDCIDIFITGNYTQMEKINFKSALSELHRKKRENELKQETEILSGGYFYYNNTLTSDPESFDSADSSDNSIEYNKNKINNPLPYVSIDKTADELSPLNLESGKLSYGATTSDRFSCPLHRKSCIELRNHNHDTSNSYNTETIDVELGETDMYEARSQSVQPNMASLSRKFENTRNATTDSTDGFKAIPENLLPKQQPKPKNLKNILDALNNTQPKSPKKSKIINPNFNVESTVNQNLFSKRPVSTTTSSALYDDLEDYWVLKHSFSKIEFGRPKLGLQYYNWCSGSSCTGPLVSLQSGKSICYNIREDPLSDFNDQFNELYLNDTFLANRKARFRERNGEPDDTVWVIGAGPVGLVDNVRLWANHCGFSFHEESFIV